jgi:hypothetical protein
MDRLTTGGRRMGLLGKLTKAGIAAKVVDEARKPKNQAKIKQLLSRLTSKGASRRPGT